jgi:hypothetical protein
VIISILLRPVDLSFGCRLTWLADPTGRAEPSLGLGPETRTYGLQERPSNPGRDEARPHCAVILGGAWYDLPAVTWGKVANFTSKSISFFLVS